MYQGKTWHVVCQLSNRDFNLAQYQHWHWYYQKILFHAVKYEIQKWNSHQVRHILFRVEAIVLMVVEALVSKPRVPGISYNKGGFLLPLVFTDAASMKPMGKCDHGHGNSYLSCMLDGNKHAHIASVSPAYKSKIRKNFVTHYSLHRNFP